MNAMGNRTMRRLLAVFVAVALVGFTVLGRNRLAYADPVPVIVLPSARNAEPRIDTAIVQSRAIVPPLPAPPIIRADAIPNRASDLAFPALKVPEYLAPLPAPPAKKAVELWPVKKPELLPPPLEIVPIPVPVPIRTEPVVPVLMPAPIIAPPTISPANENQNKPQAYAPTVWGESAVPKKKPDGVRERPMPELPSLFEPTQPSPAKNPVPLVEPTNLPPPNYSLQLVKPQHILKPMEPVAPFVAMPSAQVAETAPAPKPVPVVSNTKTTPGEFIMPLSLRKIALSTIVGATLMVAPVFADNLDKKDDATKQELEKTNALIAEMKRDLADLKSKELASIKKEIDALKESNKQTQIFLEGGSDKGSATDGLLKKMSRLEETLAAVDKKLQLLDTKLSASTRTASSSPESAKAIVEMGSVKIVNDYEIEISIVVNGKAFRIEPKETKNIDVPVGSLKYQLLGSGSSETTRTVKDKEIVTLWVH